MADTFVGGFLTHHLYCAVETRCLWAGGYHTVSTPTKTKRLTELQA